MSKPIQERGNLRVSVNGHYSKLYLFLSSTQNIHKRLYTGVKFICFVPTTVYRTIINVSTFTFVVCECTNVCKHSRTFIYMYVCMIWIDIDVDINLAALGEFQFLGQSYIDYSFIPFHPLQTPQLEVVQPEWMCNSAIESDFLSDDHRLVQSIAFVHSLL